MKRAHGATVRHVNKQTANPGRLEVPAVATSGHVFWALLQERGGGKGMSEGPAGPLGPHGSSGHRLDVLLVGKTAPTPSSLPERGGPGGTGGADSSPCPRDLPSLERGPSARVHGPGANTLHSHGVKPHGNRCHQKAECEDPSDEWCPGEDTGLPSGGLRGRQV